jgi:hypothetical protein
LTSALRCRPAKAGRRGRCGGSRLPNTGLSTDGLQRMRALAGAHGCSPKAEPVSVSPALLQPHRGRGPAAASVSPGRAAPRGHAAASDTNDPARGSQTPNPLGSSPCPCPTRGPKGSCAPPDTEATAGPLPRCGCSNAGDRLGLKRRLATNRPWNSLHTEASGDVCARACTQGRGAARKLKGSERKARRATGRGAPQQRRPARAACRCCWPGPGARARARRGEARRASALEGRSEGKRSAYARARAPGLRRRRRAPLRPPPWAPRPSRCPA